jgi:hypothetical protein
VKIYNRTAVTNKIEFKDIQTKQYLYSFP